MAYQITSPVEFDGSGIITFNNSNAISFANTGTITAGATVTNVTFNNTGNFSINSTGVINIGHATDTDSISFDAAGVIDFNNNPINRFVTTAQGDIIYASSATELTKLSIGNNGKVLTVAGGLPIWDDPAAISSKGAMFVRATASTALAALDSWTTLAPPNITWDGSVSFNVDEDSYFTPGTGVYLIPGTLTSGADYGIYDIAAQVTFDKNNTGQTSFLTTEPTGRGSRQARLASLATFTADVDLAGTTLSATAVTGAITIGMLLTGINITPGARVSALLTGFGGAGTYTITGQAPGVQTGIATTGLNPITTVATQANPGSSNYTQLALSNPRAKLLFGTQVVLQVRHDATSSLGFTIAGNDSMTWFSANRVK